MAKVYLVGAGPGAPDLLTLRAARVLGSADVVFYDALVHPETLALAKNARTVNVGKRYGKVSTEQRFINRALVEAARTHENVVRLKGGDPMLFGRAQEEIAALEAAGVRYEVVPGVTAALAASAALGISLTQRGVARSVAFVTPRVGEGEAPSEWVRSVVAADAAAIYMGAGHAEAIAAALIAAGKSPSTPIAIVENTSLPTAQTRYTTLSGLPAIAKAGIVGPALILIGPQFHAAARVARTEPAATFNKFPRAATR
jgi:uroporphyrin-III C-methyltransferase